MSAGSKKLYKTDCMKTGCGGVHHLVFMHQVKLMGWHSLYSDCSMGQTIQGLNPSRRKRRLSSPKPPE